MLRPVCWVACCSSTLIALYHVVARMSSPFTVATAVEVVTGARPRSPDVSASRKPPTKNMMRKIQMYFAELRIDCSTGLYSWRNQKKCEFVWGYTAHQTTGFARVKASREVTYSN